MVEAFRATFEEVERSDLLLHIIDASEADVHHQMEVVESVLSELDMAFKPRLKIYNKCDSREIYVRNRDDGVSVSALKREGLSELVSRLDTLLAHGFKCMKLVLPHTAGRILSELYRVGRVIETDHTKKSVVVIADLPQKLVGRYKKYCI